MARRMIIALALAFAALAGVPRAPAATVAALPAYSITDLGSFGRWSEAWAVNNHGQVVGASLGPSNVIQPFLWESGVLSRLASPRTGLHTLAKGINDAGQVAGYSHDAVTPARSYIWSADDVVELGLLPGGHSASAMDINSSGSVALTTDGPAAVYHNRAITALDGNGCCTSAMAINDAGVVAGQAPGFGPPAIWRDGTRQDLPTLGGATGRAEAINEAGIVVGAASTTGGDSRAFMWDGAIQELGTLGGPNSTALDINEYGVIVGTSDTGSGVRDRHAFIWYSGALYDLNDLLPPESGWTLTVARAINDRGQIVGTGIHNDQERAFLLTPTEPAGGPDLEVRARYDGLNNSDAVFRITVTNRSRGSTASDLTITTQLPTGTTLRRATSEAGSCAGTGPVICRVPRLAAGATNAMAVVLTIAVPGRYALHVSAASREPDATPTDNRARAIADIRFDSRTLTPAPPAPTPCPHRYGCKGPS